jgi:hypothetical protein
MVSLLVTAYTTIIIGYAIKMMNENDDEDHDTHRISDNVNQSH